MHLLPLFLCLFALVGCRSQDHPASNSLRISTAEDPATLDPRLVRNLPAVSVLHMLYDGLMCYNPSGKIDFAIAEHVTLSPDGKVYTIALRPSLWNNGDPVTAQNFVDTWINTLDPKTASPNANQLFVIKGAKDFNQGKGTKVGLRAKDARTLEIVLESPTPYFLDLLASHFYFPMHPSSSNKITNGPFQLSDWKKNNELTVVKNKKYWEADKVHLDKIVIMILEEGPAYHLYTTGDLDWVGSPMSTLPQDAIATLKKEGKLQVAAGAGTHWFRLNTLTPPFNNVKIRKAFSLALNRQAIIQHVTQGNQIAALQIVPEVLMAGGPYFKDHDTTEAWELYQQALEDLKEDKDHFPEITLCYSNNERNHKIAQAVQQQWNKTFGIEVKLQSCEVKSFFDRLSKSNYQIALGSWFADIKDPISFLDVFKYKNNATNNTGWEDPEYIRLLNLSSSLKNEEERIQLLKDAEGVLMDQMPVIPLFHSTFNYLHRDNVFGVYVSELGFLDFKHASLNDPNQMIGHDIDE